MKASRPLTSPVRTGNLVLKTRIALVIRNLQHVQSALVSVKQRRADLHRILMFPERTEASIGRLGRALNRAFDGYDAGSPEDIRNSLETLNVEMKKLDQEASDLKDPVGKLRETVLLDEDEVMRTDFVANAVHDSLTKAVSAEFGDGLAKLKMLREKVDAAGQKGEADAEPMRAAWTQYSDTLYNSSEQLFEEYVDLVSGVALRDTGFDRGIARLAEELLKPGGRIGSFHWDALTIPARQEAMAVTAAGIVRLGFPEWTIWMLPLTAYELGSNYADSDKKVAEKIDALIGDNAELNAELKAKLKAELLVLVADAFATYFLGPAYACAEILIRLNPAEAFNGNRLVAKRAAVILSALRQMSENASGVEDHYAGITSRLAAEWEDALRQTCWARSESRRLTDDEQAEIDRLLDAFKPLVQQWIVSDIEAWPKVEEWAVRLRCGEKLLVSDLGGLAELRYVLNAAWRARIAVRPRETDVDDLEQLADIAQAVELLLWSLVRGLKESTTVNDTGRPRGPIGDRWESRNPLRADRWKSGHKAQPGTAPS